jgi:hypothetical protein
VFDSQSDALCPLQPGATVLFSAPFVSGELGKHRIAAGLLAAVVLAVMWLTLYGAHESGHGAKRGVEPSLFVPYAGCLEWTTTIESQRNDKADSRLNWFCWPSAAASSSM